MHQSRLTEWTDELREQSERMQLQEATLRQREEMAWLICATQAELAEELCAKQVASKHGTSMTHNPSYSTRIHLAGVTLTTNLAVHYRAVP